MLTYSVYMEHMKNAIEDFCVHLFQTGIYMLLESLKRKNVFQANLLSFERDL